MLLLIGFGIGRATNASNGSPFANDRAPAQPEQTHHAGNALREASTDLAGQLSLLEGAVGGFAGRFQLYSLLATLGVADLDQAYAFVRRDYTARARDWAREVVLIRLVALAPERALSLALSDDESDRDRLLEAVFYTWSRADFRSAAEAARRLEPQARGAVAKLLFRERAELDRDALLEMAGTLNVDPYALGVLNRPIEARWQLAGEK
ncbi:MAG: hypothetical protein AAF515_01840 [Pseudomonadota bacterium]